MTAISSAVAHTWARTSAARWSVAALATIPLAFGVLAPGQARAEDLLVISPADFSTLHLQPVAESTGAARSQLQAGLPSSVHTLIRRATVEASAAKTHGEQWRSDAFVLRSASAAARVEARWARVHRAGRVKLGAGGAAFVQRSRRRATAEVLWRQGARLGLIVLHATRDPGGARAAALTYAQLAAGYLKTPLPSTAWEKVDSQVRSNGTVSEQTALEAVALAYGALPGIAVPSGARTAPVSGDLAQEWVAPYLPRLKGKLRIAVYHVLGFALPGSSAHVASYGDSGFTPNATLTGYANKWKLIYALPTYLGHYLSPTIVAGMTTTYIHNDYTNTDAPADAASVNAEGARTADGPICRIRITPTAAGYNSLTIQHIIAHEVFHCEEFDFDPGLAHMTAWTTEGMAEWAAETLEPDPLYLKIVDDYITSPNTPLFTRNYDAEGFWGHVQDTQHNLWRTIPAILAQPTQPEQYNAAGANGFAFLGSWGSSVFDNPKYAPDWWIDSPHAATATATSQIIDGHGSIVAPPYTTSQYNVLATQPLVQVMISPPDDALLGEGVNRTNLGSVLFCAEATESACQCPPDDDGTVPPSELMKFPAFLGVSGDPKDGTVGTVTSIPLSAYCTPKPTPPPPGNQGDDGGSGGDPHMIDFAGDVYDFQQAGEFTLVKSTKGDLDVQVRQQPESSCCVSFNTATAIRVGPHAIVEVDRLGASKIAVLVNKRPAHGSHVNLGGGASLAIGSEPPFGPLATVRWPDGSTAKVFNAGGLGSGVLDVSIALAADQFGHVEGLLGNANVPAAKEFPGGNRRFYPPNVVTGISRHDANIRYDQFGKSWRITQRASLFRYGRGKSSRSYDVAGFPATYETVASLPKGKRDAAEKACRAAGVTSGQLFDACVLDVAATGDKGFAAGDAHLHDAVANVPGWSKLTDITSLPTPTLGQGAGKVFVALNTANNTGVQVSTFPDVSGAPSHIAHTTPISGWSQLGTPLLMPTADGGQQLMVSGNHSSVVSDPLNGLDVLQYEPDGSFGPPSSLDASTVEPGAADPTGAALSSNGTTLIWATGPFLNTWNDSAYPPASQNPTYPPGVLFEGTTAPLLARDTSGRLWLAWYGLPVTTGGTGVFLEQLNPATGAPMPGATPQLAPDSTAEANAESMRLVCNSICHVIYQPGSAKNDLVSWAPGQSAPVTVLDVSAAHAFTDVIGTAAAPNGQIWVVYLYAASANEQVVARLGNDDGAGGSATVLEPPSGLTDAYDGAVLSTPNGLVLSVNFVQGAKYTQGQVWGTVLPQP